MPQPPRALADAPIPHPVRIVFPCGSVSSSWLESSGRGLGHQNSDIVAVPGKITIQNTGDQGRVLVPDPGIRLQAPIGLETVRVHHENALRAPGKSEFLNLAEMVTHGSVV